MWVQYHINMIFSLLLLFWLLVDVQSFKTRVELYFCYECCLMRPWGWKLSDACRIKIIYAWRIFNFWGGRFICDLISCSFFSEGVVNSSEQNSMIWNLTRTQFAIYSRLVSSLLYGRRGVSRQLQKVAKKTSRKTLYVVICKLNFEGAFFMISSEWKPPSGRRRRRLFIQ